MGGSVRSYRFARLVFTAEDGRLRAERGGEAVTLRPQAARLLHYLLDHAGEIVPRERLYQAVWGEEAVVDFESGLAALLRELRQALRGAGGSETLIETVPRRGYRLNAGVVRDGALRPGRRRLAIILAAVVCLAAGTGLALWLAPGGRDSEGGAGSGEYSLAILPFQIFTESDRLPEHLDLLLADRILAEMVAHPLDGLTLIGRTGIRPYLGREDVAGAAARDLGVELLFEGSVLEGSDGGWRVEMRLLAVPPGRVVWASSVVASEQQRLDVGAVSQTLAGAFIEAWPGIREGDRIPQVSD